MARKKKTEYVFIDRPVRTNVGDADRALRGVLAAIFFTGSGARRGFGRFLCTLLGCALGISAVTGRSAAYKSLGVNTTDCASWRNVHDWLAERTDLD